MLYHIMSDERNGVTKFIPHRRAATKEDMENKLLEHFGRHFSQAHTTPCPQPPLDKLIGFTGEGPLVAQLKKGTADVNSVPVDGFTKDVLKEMQWNKQCPPKISEDITWEDVRHGFKIWNERTSTSPLGRHLGKYRAWLTPTKVKQTQVEEQQRKKKKTQK